MTDRRTLFTRAAAAALLAVAAGTSAQPSAYFVWKERASGKTMCEAEQPGQAWVRQSGPYDDPNCKTLSPK